jgi:hypothetical protein
MELLGLIRTLTFSCSTIDSLLMLHFALVRSKLEYASVASNPVTFTDSNKLERVQRTFAALCHIRFFQDVEYQYIEKIKFADTALGVVTSMHCFYLINVFSGTKHCPSVLETVGIRVPTRNIRNPFNKMCIYCKCKL